MRVVRSMGALLLALVLVSSAPSHAAADPAGAQSPPKGGVFSRENLVAWCIVPYDAKQRGPKERAEMLARLGIKKIAYDWRDHHVAEWDEELKQYKAHGIELVAFWAPARHSEILPLLKRHGVKAQLWVMPPEYPGGSQQRKVEMAAEVLLASALAAKEQGCTMALYNHGGWAGGPETQVAIIERLRSRGADNVGMVYNLHHGHEHVGRFAELMKLMKPHLMCLTINGMKAGGPKILPVGQGDNDLALLKSIKDSGYTGPIAILNHREEVDAEVGLKENIEGLKKLLGQVNDDQALETFRR